MDNIFIDGSSEVAADGARNSFERVGSAVDLTNSCDSVFTFDDHSQYRTGSDEVDESFEETFAFVFSIVFFSEFYRDLNHFDRMNGQTFSFEAGDHFAADVFLHAVRLYEYESFFNVSHNSLLKKNAFLLRFHAAFLHAPPWKDA